MRRPDVGVLALPRGDARVTYEVARAPGAPLERRNGPASDEEAFHAGHNARVVASAEAYYRSMFPRDGCRWNLRDEHIAGTLDALVGLLQRRRGRHFRVLARAVRRGAALDRARAVQPLEHTSPWKRGEHGQRAEIFPTGI